jgi:hypothetical protein
MNPRLSRLATNVAIVSSLWFPFPDSTKNFFARRMKILLSMFIFGPFEKRKLKEIGFPK